MIARLRGSANVWLFDLGEPAVKTMSPVWGFVLGVIGAACTWLLAEFVGRPFRHFFDLRREVSRRLVQFDNVLARAKMKGDTREPLELLPEENARLTEAQETFWDLASQMRAFAKAEYLANRAVSFFGFDAREASGR